MSDEQIQIHHHYDIRPENTQTGEVLLADDENAPQGMITTISYTRKVSDGNYGSTEFGAFMQLRPDADIDQAGKQLISYVTQQLRG